MHCASVVFTIRKHFVLDYLLSNNIKYLYCFCQLFIFVNYGRNECVYMRWVCLAVRVYFAAALKTNPIFLATKTTCIVSPMRAVYLNVTFEKRTQFVMCTVNTYMYVECKQNRNVHCLSFVSKQNWMAAILLSFLFLKLSMHPLKSFPHTIYYFRRDGVIVYVSEASLQRNFLPPR